MKVYILFFIYILFVFVQAKPNDNPELLFKPDLNYDLGVSNCDSVLDVYSKLFHVHHLPSLKLVLSTRILNGLVVLDKDSANAFFNTLKNSSKESVFFKNVQMPDYKVLTKDYLHDNTTLALNTWKYTWNEFLSFDQFCSFILPYRSYKSVYFTGDRKWIYEIFKDTLDMIESLPIPDDDKTVKVIESVNRWYNNFPKLDSVRNSINIPYLGLYNIYTYARGNNCSYQVDFLVSVLRALGVPVSIEFGPKTMQAPNHYWLFVPLPSGELLPFNPFETPHNTTFGTHPEAYLQVYRITNVLQPQNIFNYIKLDEIIPTQFADPTICEVSEVYRPTGIARVYIKNPEKHSLVYLFKFNQGGGEMKAITWELAPEDFGYVYFKKLRTNFFYFPGFYSNWGFESAGEPFWLRKDGLLKPYALDTSNCISVKLHRKERAPQGFVRSTKAMNGDQIWASNDPEFNKQQLILEITDSLGIHLNSFQIKSSGKYRYYKYLPKNGDLNLATLQLLSNSKTEYLPQPYYIGCKEDIDTLTRIRYKIYLTPIKGVPYHSSINKILDDDPLTYSTSKIALLDAGEQVKVSEIRIYPRSAVNIIERGDVYELFYYNRGWISLGVQRASYNFLEYNNVPKGALLWLRDLTKGKEESLFEYIDGAQIFR